MTIKDHGEETQKGTMQNTLNKQPYAEEETTNDDTSMAKTFFVKTKSASK